MSNLNSTIVRVKFSQLISVLIRIKISGFAKPGKVPRYAKYPTN